MTPLRFLLVLATFAAVPGCARNLVLDADDNPPVLVIKRGPPCYMALLHDGEVEASVTHKHKRCRVRIDGQETP